MGKPNSIESPSMERKAAANRGAYLAEKDAKDRVLLRLDRGTAARLDAARAPLRLSRSAFLMLRLPLALAAEDLDTATQADVSRPASPETVAEEFDQIFSAEGS